MAEGNSQGMLEERTPFMDENGCFQNSTSICSSFTVQDEES